MAIVLRALLQIALHAVDGMAAPVDTADTVATDHIRHTHRQAILRQEVAGEAMGLAAAQNRVGHDLVRP